MSSLTPIDKKKFEDLLGMSSGYVLDFTNAKFADFFQETVGIDIYSERYSAQGESKAKKLRAFWNTESDIIVSRLLIALLEYWKYLNPVPATQQQSTLYEECTSIARKIANGQKHNQSSLSDFLNTDFKISSISTMNIEASLIPILEARLVEVNKCHATGSPFAVIILCGSILEGLLLGIASKNIEKCNRSKSAPKDKTGRTKQINDWTLSDLIEVAYDVGFLKLDVKKYSHTLRDFRNYIHPYQQMASNFAPDKHTASICLQVLKAAMASLANERG